MSSGKAAKKAAAPVIARDVRANKKDLSNHYLTKLAESYVDPGGVDPIVHPSPVPARAACAKYKYVTSVSGVGTESFGIVVKPDVDEPIQISSTGTRLESALPIVGRADGNSGGNGLYIPLDLDTNTPTVMHSTEIGGRPSIPLTSASGAILQLNINLLGGAAVEAQNSVHFDAWDGSSWTTLQTVLVGGNKGISVSSANFNYGSTYMRYSLTSLRGNSPSGGPMTVKYGYGLAFQSGTTGTGNATADQFTMDVFAPDWDHLSNISDKFQIVAMDCLVTYEGSSLDNAGSIAVCNSEQLLEPTTTWYDVVSSQPYDVYRGRLSSQGQAEGGGHWHYIPDDLEALSLDRRDNSRVPTGYFGITGKEADQPVRIQVYFVVNFFTTDQSYALEIQKPITDVSPLLYYLRMQIPLVSSNDKHILKRIKSAALGGAKSIAKFAKDNPELVAAGMALLI